MFAEVLRFTLRADQSQRDSVLFHQVYSPEVQSGATKTKFNIRPSTLGEPSAQHHLLSLSCHQINRNNQVESSPTSSVSSKSSVSSTDTTGRPESWRPSDSGDDDDDDNDEAD